MLLNPCILQSTKTYGVLLFFIIFFHKSILTFVCRFSYSGVSGDINSFALFLNDDSSLIKKNILKENIG